MKKTGTKKVRSKKKSEPEMTWKEAVLAYQINIKEKALEDVQYEMKILDDGRNHFTERIKALKNEQSYLMDDLLKISKIPENDVTAISKEEVTLQMKENWATRSKNEQSLEELKKTLLAKDEEISSRQHLFEYWKDYRDRGQHEQRKQIRLLLENNADMEATFETMTGHMVQNLSKTKEDIERKTVETLDQQKYIAAEKAIANMDKYSKQEAIDHDWLSCEIQVHRRETQELLHLVEKLESENLKILNELFHCQMEDLRVSRGFLLTEVPDSDDFLDDKSFLEIDLSKLKSSERDLYSLNTGDNFAISTDSEENREDALVEYLQCHDLNSDDFDEIGLRNLELKSLNVSGEKLRIHKPKTPSINEIKTRLYRPDDWPVTKSMLLDAIEGQ